MNCGNIMNDKSPTFTYHNDVTIFLINKTNNKFSAKKLLIMPQKILIKCFPKARCKDKNEQNNYKISCYVIINFLGCYIHMRVGGG